jgi:hypothetical protein
MLANREDIKYNPIGHIQERIEKNRKPMTRLRGRGGRCSAANEKQSECRPEVQ